LHVGFSLKGRTKLLQRDDKLKSINMLDWAQSMGNWRAKGSQW